MYYVNVKVLKLVLLLLLRFIEPHEESSLFVDIEDDADVVLFEMLITFGADLGLFSL